jgi:plastocyanin
MSDRLIPAFFLIAVLSVAACAGATSTGTAGAGSPSVAASAPAASTDAGTGAACAPSTEPGTVQAAMAGSSFTPSTIQAKVGDVVAWTNNDSIGHTATVDDDPVCTTETLAAGATGAITFSAAGSYAFHCKIHSNMTGTIEVTE